MAPADDNNAMPPRPLVAPLDVDVTQRLAGGYAMQNRGRNGSPAAQMTPLSRVANIASASATSSITMSRAASLSTTAGDDDQRERAADEGSGEEGEDGKGDGDGDDGVL